MIFLNFLTWGIKRYLLTMMRWVCLASIHSSSFFYARLKLVLIFIFWCTWYDPERKNKVRFRQYIIRLHRKFLVNFNEFLGNVFKNSWIQKIFCFEPRNLISHRNKRFLNLALICELASWQISSLGWRSIYIKCKTINQ